MLLGGCSGGDGDGSGTADSSAPATTAADGTTLPGTKLGLGESAVVRFAPDAKHDSTIDLVVDSVREGTIRDLDEFTLTAAAKSSTVYYVKLSVENLGRDDLAGEFVPVYGKVSESLVVQPVTFGATFGKCDYKPLPKKFTKGKRTSTCVVLMAPKHGTVSTIEWRGPDGVEPISWSIPT
jgi:hypothetical protein